MSVEGEREKTRIFLWRGLIDSSAPIMRITVAIVLAIAGVAIAFMQLGFVDVNFPDGTSGYVVSLMVVVSLGALLVGTVAGAVLGIAIGSALLLHSVVMPLDHYELLYVTPLTSIVMLGAAGALAGILFAFVLRKNPPQVRRMAYIAIVCIVVAWLYSLGFFHSVIDTVYDNITAAGSAYAELDARELASMEAMQLGDLGIQAWMTAALMVVVCIIGDYGVRQMLKRRKSMGLRAVFGARLFAVVLLAFMASSALIFTAITADELSDTEKSMKNKADYLSSQLAKSNDRFDIFFDMENKGYVELFNMEAGLQERLIESFSDDFIVEGFATDENELIIVIYDGEVYLSNNYDKVARKSAVYEAFDDRFIDAADYSIEYGTMQRFIYDESAIGNATSDSAHTSKADPQIAYLYAQQFSSDSEAGQSGEEDSDVCTVVIMETSGQVFAERAPLMAWMSFASFALQFAVFFIVFRLLNRVVARRIDEENAALAQITAGNLDVRAEAGGTREFASLSAGINTTVDTLKGWIAEAESRMDAELATAKAIQEAALPRTFPPFPDIENFDIYASMKAAKEVGGDFYDFFLVGEGGPGEGGKLGFVMADVSGKGVPAALFMMKAKALISEHVSSGGDLGEAVNEANRRLCEGNDEGMFVTAWIGVLDYGTGHVDFVNAGHNPPLLRRSGEGWSWLRDKSGPMLGLFGKPYRVHSIECRAGDAFLLYTDGVTEAFDVNEELYGEDRLLAVAEKGTSLHPRELLESLRTDMAAYTEGAEQSDDITILALEILELA